MRNTIWRTFEPELGLLAATVAWGITFPLIRIALADMDPNDFVAIRFIISTSVLLPFILLSPARRQAVLKSGPVALCLGLVVFLVFISQTIGLQTVSSPRGAFITGTSLLFVPVLSILFGKGYPKAPDIIAALIATGGLYLLVDPGSVSGVSVGDIWILFCALLIALQIHLIHQISKRGLDDLVLAFLQIAGVAVCAVSTLPFIPRPPIHWSGPVVTSLLVCAVFVTTGTLWLQAKYQKRTTPERAALIFSMEPVFATVFGYLILGETLSPRGLAGAALILCAVVGAELMAKIRRDRRKSHSSLAPSEPKVIPIAY